MIMQTGTTEKIDNDYFSGMKKIIERCPVYINNQIEYKEFEFWIQDSDYWDTDKVS